MTRGLLKMLAAALLCSAAMAASAQPQLTQVREFGSNPGSLRMFYYVPRDLPANAPLVVVAHGCLGSADVIATTSGWLEVADRAGIALVFPETSKRNEPWAGCFRTWEAAHAGRDAGEPLSVRQMIAHMRALFPLDPARTYMTGTSSGGHLTNIMLVAYPEVFEAGAVQSAFPFGCATSAADLGPCSSVANERSAGELGDLIRSARPDHEGPWPRMQLWHGELDEIIHYPNLAQLVLQWTDAQGIDAVPDSQDDILSHPRARYADADGRVLVEAVTVKGMGHAVAVDPGDAAPQCGKVAPFVVDAGICAAHWIGDFFGIVE